MLVVEADPALAQALARALRSEHDVVVLGSVRVALHRIAAGERFDVILCDLVMRDLSGIDLWTSAPAQRDAMVFMTGTGFAAAAREFLQRDGCSWIDKPFELDVLRRVVRDRAAAQRAGGSRDGLEVPAGDEAIAPGQPSDLRATRGR